MGSGAAITGKSVVRRVGIILGVGGTASMLDFLYSEKHGGEVVSRAEDGNGTYNKSTSNRLSGRGPGSKSDPKQGLCVLCVVFEWHIRPRWYGKSIL